MYDNKCVRQLAFRHTTSVPPLTCAPHFTSPRLLVVQPNASPARAPPRRCRAQAPPSLPSARVMCCAASIGMQACAFGARFEMREKGIRSRELAGCSAAHLILWTRLLGLPLCVRRKVNRGPNGSGLSGGPKPSTTYSELDPCRPGLVIGPCLERKRGTTG